MPVDGSPTRSRAERVAAELEAEVLTSRAPTGTRLGLRTELIRRFGVSPSVMSEALRILRQRGLVAVRPGAHGGVFVADQPPQVQMGAIDLWFSSPGPDPRPLFEARMHLEDLLSGVALRRATPEDLRAMEWALHEMHLARDARAYLEANMRLHLAVARASRIEVLAGLYEALVAVLVGGMSRAVFLEGHREMLEHNLEVHANLIGAIRDQDGVALEKVLVLHREDTVRMTGPA